MTKFYIVRHGETDWNKQKKAQGHTDIPLNETGEVQAKDVAKLLKDIKFDLAFSSDLLRAKRTAEIIALEHNLAVQTTEALREKGLGTLEGKSTNVFRAELELLKALSHEERIKHRFNDESEIEEEFISRIFTFLRETAIAYPEKNILVGTHGGVLHMLLVHLGVMTYNESDMTKIHNAAYIKVESDGVEFFVKEQVGIEPRK
jgi:broad specificity phosphatase PhoE